jgi:hypothetical protein
VLGYLSASQLIPLLPLLERHRRYYSGHHFRFPVADRDRDREEEKEEDTEGEDETVSTAEESGPPSWQVVHEVPYSSLYNVVPIPPGVPTGRLRLHPQALLIVR